VRDEEHPDNTTGTSMCIYDICLFVLSADSRASTPKKILAILGLVKINHLVGSLDIAHNSNKP